MSYTNSSNSAHTQDDLDKKQLELYQARNWADTLVSPAEGIKAIAERLIESPGATVKEVVSGLLQTRPEMFRQQEPKRPDPVSAAASTNKPLQYSNAEATDCRQYFGSGSSTLKASRLMKESPELYHKYKRIAQAELLIA